MVTKKTLTQFAEVEDDTVVEEEETIVTSELKSARVKGTWNMYWGTQMFPFEDGKRYRLPVDLYEYLKSSGNIYDTL